MRPAGSPSAPTGRSPFRIALTGGSTPRPVYERLAELPLDWPSWHVWWSDERVVPPDHPDSNERLAREALLSRVPIPEEQIHPLRSLGRRAAASAFDLVLLGLGSDGHTASLFPGHEEELADPGPLVYVPVPGLPPPHPRISFSLPYLNAQPLVAFLVAGEEKRDLLARDPRRRRERSRQRGSAPRRRSSSRDEAAAATVAEQGALDRLADGEDERVVARAGGDLERGGQAVLGGAARERERRPAGGVERPRQRDHPLAQGEVAEADRRRDHRHRRREEDVEALERLERPPAVGLALGARGARPPRP